MTLEGSLLARLDRLAFASYPSSTARSHVLRVRALQLLIPATGQRSVAAGPAVIRVVEAGLGLLWLALNVGAASVVPTQSLGLATQWQSERPENGADTANAPLIGRVGPERSVASIDLCYKKASPQSAQDEARSPGLAVKRN
jgi:hypothetical protein